MAGTIVSAEAMRVRRLAKRLHLTQQRIAIETGISQSQVSRLLSGQSVRRSRAFDSVCTYVQRLANTVSTDEVRRCGVLMDALAAVWDGSQSHADALAAVIRSLGALAPPHALGHPQRRSPHE